MKLNKPILLDGDIIGVDLGMSRTGVARMHTLVRIAEPLEEILMKEQPIEHALQEHIDENSAVAVVVGVPRDINGRDTEQTRWTLQQIEVLEKKLSVPVFTTDEAGTTKLAEEQATPSQSVDSVAAGIILEDFANQVRQGSIEHVSF